MLIFFYFFLFFREGDGLGGGDQDGGELRYRGAHRPHPARGQRRSTGATSRRLGQRREQTAQPNTGKPLVGSALKIERERKQTRTTRSETTNKNKSCRNEQVDS